MPETEEGKRAPRKIEIQIQIIFFHQFTQCFFGDVFYIHKNCNQFAPLYIVHLHTNISGAKV